MLFAAGHTYLQHHPLGRRYLAGKDVLQMPAHVLDTVLRQEAELPHVHADKWHAGGSQRASGGQ